MKASFVILLIASFAYLSFAQIAGAVNEAPKPNEEDQNMDLPTEEEGNEVETPMNAQNGFVVPVIDNTGQTAHEKTTKKHPAPVSLKYMH